MSLTLGKVLALVALVLTVVLFAIGRMGVVDAALFSLLSVAFLAG